MTRARSLMIVGTTSNAGKSLVATAFCRYFRELGYSVAPFKAQNMSNNSFVTADGGEMGRAQVGQAEAAAIEPHVDMNPVLLKPTSDQGSQVILQGRPVATVKAREYYAMKKTVWQTVCESYARLASRHDIIVLEGAGSPVEINLRDKDIVNMRMAREARAPTVLVADIERGGVFASAAGTYGLLTPEERALMCGTLVNKFRGDTSLFDSGGPLLEEHTGAPYLGLLPYIDDLTVDEEDGLSVAKIAAASRSAEQSEIILGLISLPRISNLTDVTPLWSLAGVAVRPVRDAAALAGCDAIVLPGTKSTMQDLQWMHDRGLSREIVRLHRDEAVPVIGICGGYQILGARLCDPEGVEDHGGTLEGLGLLPGETVFHRAADKVTCQAKLRAGANHPFLAPGTEIDGYEIHSGQTAPGPNAPQAYETRGDQACDAPEGAIALSDSSFVLGSYLHGYFDRQEVTLGLLNHLRKRKGLSPVDAAHVYDTARAAREESYARLADSLREHVDLKTIHRAMGL